MWVGCQSRRFNCLFWRETRQRILGHEISPYPEVVRGGEWELTTRPRRESWWLESREARTRDRQLVVGQERGSWWLEPRRDSWWQETKRGELVAGTERRQLRLDKREANREAGVDPQRGSQHQTPSRETRREDRVQWRRVSRCLIPVALWNFR